MTFGIMAGCVIPALDVLDLGAPVTTDGSGGSGGVSDAAGGAGGEEPSSCEPKTWQAPPTASDPGGTDVSFVVAVRSLDFGETDLQNGPKVGFDLDNRCSCLGDSQSCQLTAQTTNDPCDGPGGIDNQAAFLFDAASTFDPQVSSEVQSERAETGAGTLLIEVRDYNGQLADDDVTVALYTSPGLTKDHCNPDGTLPAWTGSDRWPVGASSVMDPPGFGSEACGPVALTPMFWDDEAYVSKGVLVANLPTATVQLSSADNAPSLNLTAGFVTGKPTNVDGNWSLREGLFAARWRVSDVFNFVSSLEIGGSPLCTSHPLYQAIRTAVCSAPDITATLGGPTTPCDAISIAFAFEAEQAILGEVYQSGDGVPSCPRGEDPAMDTCGNSE